MNMINRLICQINANYHLDNIINTINVNKYKEEESQSNTEDVLKSYIEISDIVEGNNFNFIYGTYYYEYDAPAQVPIITETGARIREITIIKNNILDFWISDKIKHYFQNQINLVKKVGQNFLKFYLENIIRLNQLNSILLKLKVQLFKMENLRACGQLHLMIGLEQ